MRICIYCASSALVHSVYFNAAERLATEMVRAEVEVVYGGGTIGLMGKIADTVLTLGGQIKGVIPKFMDEVEWTHPKLTDVVFTETMSERKNKLIENVDAVVALPGGTGTLEELLETISQKRLGLFSKPIVILNTNKFYNPLKQMLEQCVTENFMRQKHLALWSFANEPEEVLPIIRNTADWDKNALQSAVVR
ncbi:MAG: TIGR00730 family Rossman fold protein [Planctomycetaceae bacterium]|jgi:uncharacterized protein (TIGR00730 family)|nr:TIGR00730 family Rossman fold protein [Planctomycetaceae bacterium]